MASLNSGRALPRHHTPYDFKQQLAEEAKNQHYVDLLFMPHTVVDMSKDKVEQKNGNDFFLYPENDTESAPIRCENKFENKTTGNFVVEFISYDRPRIAPGWVFTSKCASLMSWFPTGEVCVWQMAELREWAFEHINRFNGTTARNRKYLTWNLCAPIEIALKELPSSRVLDLRYELGFVNTSDARNIISAKLKEQRQCTAKELVEHLRNLPRESTPCAVDRARLIDSMQIIEKKNLMQNFHVDMIDELPLEYGLRGSNRTMYS